MKKLILGACALMAVAAVSCSKGSCDKGCATANDSVSYTYGEYVGTMMQSEFSQFSGMENDSRKEFLRGMQLIFGANPTNNERMGMRVAPKCFRNSTSSRLRASKSTALLSSMPTRKRSSTIL